MSKAILRLDSLTEKYGTDEERARTLVAHAEMAGLEEVFPGGAWHLEELELPRILCARAVDVAKRRHAAVRRWSMDNRHGMTRTLDDEVRSAEGQFAACIMLGFPFNHLVTAQQGRRMGNLGNGTSAFVPKPGNFSLIVGEKEPANRRMVLMLQDSVHCYRFGGWIRAGAAKREEFQREYVRGSVVSRPYVVPSDFLRPLTEWT